MKYLQDVADQIGVSNIYVDKINIEPLRAFVIKSSKEFGSKAKGTKANKVADIIWQKFEYLGFINDGAQQQFVDITLAAALLHNLFYKPDDITTILEHRTKLADIAKEFELDERLMILVYEIIECQLGENHPIQKLKPMANSPASTFAEAVWQVNEYKSRV